MALLFYGKQPFTGSSATTSAAGYPSANATYEALGRPWRSTVTTASEWVGNFAAGVFVQAFCLHDVNFASATIQVSIGGGAFTNVGVMNTYADRHGRRRGRITINQANVTAIKVQIAAGATTDGAAYQRIGAAYAFANVVTPSGIPAYTYRKTTRRPRVSSNLVNGAVAVASTGQNVDLIELSFVNQASELVDDFVQRASAGTVWLDMGVPSMFPEQQWPVRMVTDAITEEYPRPTWYTIGSLPFMEQV